MDPQQPVFFDASQRRDAFYLIARNILIVLVICCVTGFIVTIAVNPQLPAIALSRAAKSVGLAHATSTSSFFDRRPSPLKPLVDIKTRGELRYVLKKSRELQDVKVKLAEAIRSESEAPRIPIAIPGQPTVQAPVRAAFFANWDQSSAAVASVKDHIDETTHLMPVWLQVNSNGDGIVSSLHVNSPLAGVDADDAPQSPDSTVIDLARRKGVAIVPVIQNADQGEFQSDRVDLLVKSKPHRAAVIAELLQFVTVNHFQGINVDFEIDDTSARPGITLFMTELAAAFHPLGLLVTQDIQIDSSSYDLQTLSRIDDFLVPMLYDEHSPGDDAGPIASQGWFENQAQSFFASVPANKVVAGVGSFSYDWANGDQDAQSNTFEDAATTAQEHKDGSEGVIRYDSASLNPYYTYWDDDNGQLKTPVAHIAWMLDATTVYNEALYLQRFHPLGMALWRMGTEDSSVWQFFGKSHASNIKNLPGDALANINYDNPGVSLMGHGDVLTVVSKSSPGLRQITRSTHSGMITNEQFLSYPTEWVIRCKGIVGGPRGTNRPKVVALTFDDGPDPRWTPRILDILERYHVPATFFVVGENAEAHPGILEREWRDGMEIGNHSYTHPDLDKVSPLRAKLELDATQRIIEAMTGHMTTLFRAPNKADSEPGSEAELQSVEAGDRLGYLFVGEQIDPTDWLPGIKQQQIANYVVANAWRGNCILLHDAGGNTREETIKALPRIIQALKTEGYRFVAVSTLIGKPKSVVFPPVTGKQLLTVAYDRAMFDIAYWIGAIFAGLFMLAIVLGIWRLLFMGTLAVLQSKREKRRVFDPDYLPTVSVVIAAYNEAKVINRTIANLLAGDYPNLEVVVVDDGSSDGTANVVRVAYERNPQVTVLTKANGGKATALNVGVKACRGEIVVALDADTIFAPDTISRLVRHFEDKTVGAVSGNVKVGNRTNMLTIWQAVEYITSQNFDRRAFDLLNCISVVPGAVGAWRKDAIVLAGMYSSQTLAEDTDLTFKVRRLGYKILTDNSALAFTEAPDTLKNLAKQRFRWAFGTLQCLWKHRDATFNLRYGAFGFVALPSLWIYQILFQALGPIVDLTILWSLLFNMFVSPIQSLQNLEAIGIYYLFFVTIELIGGVLAFALDKEDMRLPWTLPLQRLVYRQLMYYVIIRSIVFAFRGCRVGWGKFERKGTVRQPVSAPRPQVAVESTLLSHNATTSTTGVGDYEVLTETAPVAIRV